MCEQVNEFHVMDERRGPKKSVGSRMTDAFLSSLGIALAPHKPRDYVEESHGMVW